RREANTDRGGEYGAPASAHRVGHARTWDIAFRAAGRAYPSAVRRGDIARLCRILRVRHAFTAQQSCESDLTRFASATRPCCRRSKSCWPPAIARWCCYMARATKPSCSTARSSRRSRKPIPASSSTAASAARRVPCRVPPTAAAMCRTCWPNSAPALNATSPTCAAPEHGQRRVQCAEGVRSAGAADKAREVHLVEVIGAVLAHTSRHAVTTNRPSLKGGLSLQVISS